MTKEEINRIKAILAVNPADLLKYAEFLKHSKTGIFRIFPDLDCLEKNLVRVDGGCGNLVLNSWFFSFRKNAYSSDNLFDIKLKDGKFVSNGVLSQGIIVSLGDIPLENLEINNSDMKFLNDFQPEDRLNEIKKQFERLANVQTNDGFKNFHQAKAEESFTYAVRVVAYRTDYKFEKAIKKNAKNPEMRKLENVLYDKKRFDITVGFRVIRKDSDGGLTIVWKELNRKKSPIAMYTEN